MISLFPYPAHPSHLAKGRTSDQNSDFNLHFLDNRSLCHGRWSQKINTLGNKFMHHYYSQHYHLYEDTKSKRDTRPHSLAP
jgi:hypothetical protein